MGNVDIKTAKKMAIQRLRDTEYHIINESFSEIGMAEKWVVFDPGRRKNPNPMGISVPDPSMIANRMHLEAPYDVYDVSSYERLSATVETTADFTVYRVFYTGMKGKIGSASVTTKYNEYTTEYKADAISNASVQSAFYIRYVPEDNIKRNQEVEEEFAKNSATFSFVFYYFRGERIVLESARGFKACAFLAGLLTFLVTLLNVIFGIVRIAGGNDFDNTKLIVPSAVMCILAFVTSLVLFIVTKASYSEAKTGIHYFYFPRVMKSSLIYSSIALSGILIAYLGNSFALLVVLLMVVNAFFLFKAFCRFLSAIISTENYRILCGIYDYGNSEEFNRDYDLFMELRDLSGTFTIPRDQNGVYITGIESIR